MIKEKLELIVFIDDDAATNFLHNRTAQQANCTKKVMTFVNAVDALTYLKDTEHDDYIRPNLIFLDINMPIMNGWEFIEEYNKLDKSLRSDFILVMLTTSLNPMDKVRAKELNLISDFQNKPLKSEDLISLIKKNFPDRF